MREETRRPRAVQPGSLKMSAATCKGKVKRLQLGQNERTFTASAQTAELGEWPNDLKLAGFLFFLNELSRAEAGKIQSGDPPLEWETTTLGPNATASRAKSIEKDPHSQNGCWSAGVLPINTEFSWSCVRFSCQNSDIHFHLPQLCTR